MGRSLVADEDAAAFGGLSFGLPLDQARHAGGQKGDLALLSGDHVGQVLDGAGQMGDLFLKACDVIHTPQIVPVAGEINPPGRPVVALARGPR